MPIQLQTYVLTPPSSATPPLELQWWELRDGSTLSGGSGASNNSNGGAADLAGDSASGVRVAHVTPAMFAGRGDAASSAPNDAGHLARQVADLCDTAAAALQGTFVRSCADPWDGLPEPTPVASAGAAIADRVYWCHWVSQAASAGGMACWALLDSTGNTVGYMAVQMGSAGIYAVSLRQQQD